jgi:hypothetical protein
MLLADIPEDLNTRVALIVPIRNISKEEAETLTLPPANKRAKSPTGDAVPKRGGRGRGSRGGRKPNVKKETIKEEAKEEEDVKIEEEIQEDSDFLEANEIGIRKRKYMPNSLYPLDQYDIN